MYLLTALISQGNCMIWEIMAANLRRPLVHCGCHHNDVMTLGDGTASRPSVSNALCGAFVEENINILVRGY